MPIFGQKCHFWGDGVKLLIFSYQIAKETPFHVGSVWLQLAAWYKNVLFGPVDLDIGAKSQFFLYGDRVFLSTGYITRGILVRLVMHLFWGEKYKDLWFYTLFYIFITLFVIPRDEIVKGNLTKSSNIFLEPV